MGAGGTGVIVVPVWNLTHVWLTGMCHLWRANYGTTEVWWNLHVCPALVTPWFAPLHTPGATSPRKLLVAGLLALPHRLQIKAGRGPMVPWEKFAGGQ